MWLVCRLIFNRLQWEFVVSRSDSNRIVVFFFLSLFNAINDCVFGYGMEKDCDMDRRLAQYGIPNWNSCHVCVCVRTHSRQDRKMKWERQKEKWTCTNIEIETKTKALSNMRWALRPPFSLFFSSDTKQQWRTNASAIDIYIVWAVSFDFFSTI